MEHFVSLWLFTFASQTAIGMVLVKSVLVAAGRIRTGDPQVLQIQKVLAVLLLFSLATAFFHLGRPLRAVYALNNISSSPLSMEIASLSLLLAAALAGLWFLRRGSVNLLTQLLPWIEMITALLLLLTMTAVYMLPSVPAWFTFRTPLAFVLTVVSAGTAAMAIVSRSPEQDVARWLAASGVVATLLLAIFGFEAGMGSGLTGKALYAVQVMFSLSGFVAVAIAFSSGNLNKTRRMTVTTAIVVLFSGFIARLLFFLSYDNTIL